MVSRSQGVKGLILKPLLDYGQSSAQARRDRPRVHCEYARVEMDNLPDHYLLDQTYCVHH